MPDTKRAQVLHAVDGKWRTASQVFDAVDFDNKKLVSSALSTFFRKHGYVKRRGEKPREYSLTVDGKDALKKGERVQQEADS